MASRLFRLLAILSLIAFLPATGRSELGTREEAVAMVERAVAYFDAHGLEALSEAVADKTDPAFHDRDLYVFILDDTGTFVAHGAVPALASKNLYRMRDQNGVAMIQAFIEVGRDPGEGWVDYMWLNPKTSKLADKSSFIKRLNPGLYLGVGIYKVDGE